MAVDQLIGGGDLVRRTSGLSFGDVDQLIGGCDLVSRTEGFDISASIIIFWLFEVGF